MAQAPIQAPYVHSTALGYVTQRAAISDSTNTLAAQQFVAAAGSGTGQALTACTAQQTTVYGLVLDPSHTSTSEPYTAPFGEDHNPVDVLNTLFVVNCVNTARATGAGVATGLTLGGTYAMAPFTTAAFTNVQALNVDVTTNPFFRVEGFIDPPADTNARVIVSVVATRQ